MLLREGLCDASAAVPVGKEFFVVASDENNVLRAYRREMGGKALQRFDLNAFLTPDPDEPEVDIEGATLLDGQAYWISSHGRNRKGKERLSRQRLFATEFSESKGRVSVRFVGRPYQLLLQDILSAKQLSFYHLSQAAKLPPKALDALNIEGLAATPDGQLLIGFRNPVPKRKAILLPLRNPKKVVQGSRADLGSPIELDLAGLGIRGIEYWPERKQYFIIAGPRASGLCRIYLWSGRADQPPQEIVATNLAGWACEGCVLFPDALERGVMLLSDDGAFDACKEQKKAGRPGSFRTGWTAVP